MKELSEYSPSIAPTGSTAYGTLKNETAPEEGDGTAVVAEHIQDLQYALYAILQLAGQSPNGTLESTSNKQLLSAMGQILSMKYNVGTTYAKGMLAWEIAADVFKCYVSKTNANLANAFSSSTDWQLFYSVGINGVVTFNDIFYDNSGTSLSASTVQAAITEVSSVALPVGTILEYAGSTAPTGYLMADGSAVSRTTYANLFAVHGVTFGIGDGVTTFNLPSKKGRKGVGYDATQTEFNTLGKIGGAKTVTLTAAQSGSPLHGHPTRISKTAQGTTGSDGNGGCILENSDDANYVAYTGTPDATAGHQIGGNTPQNATESHGILDPYITLNYIIKY